MLHNFSKSIQKFCVPVEGNANLLGGPLGTSQYRPSCFSSTIIPAAAPKEMQVSRCSLPVPGPRLHYVYKKAGPHQGWEHGLWNLPAWAQILLCQVGQVIDLSGASFSCLSNIMNNGPYLTRLI